MDLQLSLPHWALLGAGLLVASIYDLGWRRVPNWLSVALLAVGLGERVLAGWPDRSLVAGAWGLAGATAGLLLLLGPFARRWIAGGDVKLLAATGGWLGPLGVLHAALYSAVAGGLLALVYWLRSPRAVRREVVEHLKEAALSQRMPEVAPRPQRATPPYALAITVGAMLAALLKVRLISI